MRFWFPYRKELKQGKTLDLWEERIHEDISYNVVMYTVQQLWW